MAAAARADVGAPAPGSLRVRLRHSGGRAGRRSRMAPDHRLAADRGSRVIGLLGATGGGGRAIAAELAERGVDTRALVRRPDADEPVPAAPADLDAPATLPAAL